jgi:hypothetical protein
MDLNRDQWKTLEAERRRKMEAVEWFRDCLIKHLEEENINVAEYKDEGE